MSIELVVASGFILFMFYRYGADPQLGTQIHLLSNVSLWYVTPLMIGIVGLTGERILRQWRAGRSILFQSAYLILVITIGVGAIHLNRLAVKKLRHERLSSSSSVR